MPEPPRPPRKPAEALTEGRIDFAYTVFWTKMVRSWEADKRRDLARQVAALIESPDFLNNAFERKYTLDGLDDQAHSGASMLALKKVLGAFDPQAE